MDPVSVIPWGSLGGGVLGWSSKIFYDRWFGVRVHRLANRRDQDNFYRHLTRAIQVNTSVRILNFSNRPIGSGKSEGRSNTPPITYNDDHDMPHRGLYFEVEEMLLTRRDERFRDYLDKNQRFKGIKRWWVRLTTRKTRPGFCLYRTFSVVSEASYAAIKKAGRDDDLRVLRDRHVSIFEHLERVESSICYGVTAITTAAYLPNPTIVIIGNPPGSQGGYSFGVKAFWGFLRTLTEIERDVDDLSIQFRQTSVIDALRKLAERYNEQSMDVVLIKSAERSEVKYRALVRMNPLLVEEVTKMLGDRLKTETMRAIEEELALSRSTSAA